MFLNEECYRNEIDSLKAKVHELSKENNNLLSQVQTLEVAKVDDDSNFKALNSQFKALKLQVKEVVSFNSELSDRCDELEKTNSHLTKELQESKTIVTRFANSEQSLNLILGNCFKTNHKHGIGYNPNFPKKSQTTFVKPRNRYFPTCFYCGKVGHIKYTCPFRSKDPQIVRNSFPFALKGQVRQIWVQKGTRPCNMADPEYESKFYTWSNSQLRQ
jgi:hypothetical protein